MAWYWPFPAPPRLDWLQVEISSCCNAACCYCPHTLFRARWHDRLLELDRFRPLLPVFKKTGLVFLQGWGEPFTHPDFFAFVRLAKGVGCQVGTTTNGMLLDEGCCERLVEEGVDILGLSLAGVGTDNDRVRQGTRLSQVLEVIATIERIKQRTGTDRPALHIAYLLLKSGLPTLGKLPELLKDRGLTQVVISTLDPMSNASLASESLVAATDQERQDYQRQLEEVVAAGAASGLSIHYRLPAAVQQEDARAHSLDDLSPLSVAALHGCTENIQRAAFVGVNGTVSPCVFVNLPMANTSYREGGGDDGRDRSLLFGNLEGASFAAIWQSPRYAALRRAHGTGDLTAPCRQCSKRLD